MTRRLIAVAVLSSAAGILVPAAGSNVAGVATAQPSTQTGSWSQLPSAARAPIAAALVRDGLTAKPAQIAQSTLTPRGGAANDNFGDSVAVSGTTVVVGAPIHTVGSNIQQGAVYVFTRPATGWKNAQQSAELTVGDGQAHDRFGYAVAMQGSTIVVGGVLAKVGQNVGQGAVYVYRRPAKGWRTTRIQPPF